MINTYRAITTSVPPISARGRVRRGVGVLFRQIDRRVPAVVGEQHGAKCALTSAAGMANDSSGSDAALIGKGAAVRAARRRPETPDHQDRAS